MRREIWAETSTLWTTRNNIQPKQSFAAVNGNSLFWSFTANCECSGESSESETSFQTLPRRREGNGTNPVEGANSSSSSSHCSVTPGGSGSATPSGRRSAETTRSSTPSPGRGTGGPSTAEEGEEEDSTGRGRARDRRRGGAAAPSTTGAGLVCKIAWESCVSLRKFKQEVIAFPPPPVGINTG